MKPRRAITHNSVAGQKIIPTKRAAKNKLVNQQQMREKIAARGHLTQAVQAIRKLTALEVNVQQHRTPLTPDEITKITLRTGILKTAFEAHMKMVNKFLPDLRSVNFESPDGSNPLEAAARAWALALEQDPD